MSTAPDRVDSANDSKSFRSSVAIQEGRATHLSTDLSMAFCIPTKKFRMSRKKLPVDTKEPAVRKTPSKWTETEDESLMAIMTTKIDCNPVDCKWPEVADMLGTGRTGKQCRDRWLNYLRPGIKKGDWTEEEERLLQDMYATFGPKWIAMATILKNRTDNDLKNKWNSMQRKMERLAKLPLVPTVVPSTLKELPPTHSILKNDSLVQQNTAEVPYQESWNVREADAKVAHSVSHDADHSLAQLDARQKSEWLNVTTNQ